VEETEEKFIPSYSMVGRILDINAVWSRRHVTVIL